MGNPLINIKLDLTKIEKERLFKSEKTGSIYLDGTLIPTPNSEYSDYMLVQDRTKEEREAGEKGAPIGSGSVFTPKSEKIKTDDLPF